MRSELNESPARNRWLEVLCALILALVLHRPGLLSFGRAIPGGGNSDALRQHWAAWVMAAELPGDPFQTRLAGFPEGVQLIPLPPISLGLVSPITAALGATLGLVALLMIHTMLCVMGGSFLARVIGARPGPALASGLLLATTPILGVGLKDGAYEYQTLGWMALMMAALICACRGSWRWGIAAGALYLVTLLECGYYGSAAALAALVMVPCLVRSREGGIAAAASAATVGLGAWLCWMKFAPILDRLQSHMQSSSGGDGQGSLSGMDMLAALPFMARVNPDNGFSEPLSAPSMLLWIGAVAGLILVFRKTWWLGLLSLMFLLLAMGSPAMAWWSTSPLGQHVGMPMRYNAPLAVGLCAMAALGLSHALDRWKSGQWSLKGGIGVGIVAALLSASRSGALTDYPLLWTPEDPSFIEALADLPEDGGVIVIPQEQPEARPEADKATKHNLLSNDSSFSNPQARLFWQTRMDRPMRHYSHLGTLLASTESRLGLDRMPQGGGAGFFEPQEIEELQRQGLAAIVIDHGALDSPVAGPQLASHLEKLGASCQSFDDWQGVSVCTLGTAP